MISFGFLLAFYNPGNCTCFLVIHLQRVQQMQMSSFLASSLIDMLACDFFPSSAIGSFGSLHFYTKFRKLPRCFCCYFVVGNRGGVGTG